MPVLETDKGCISEATAIARFVARMRADSNLFGGSFFAAGQVDQWIEFAKNELDLPIGMWIYPILGFIPSNETNTKQAKEDLARGLAVLEGHLAKHKYLVGSGVTLADVIICCSLLNAFKLVLDKAYMAPYPSLVRWFVRCVAEPQFVNVIGPTQLLDGIDSDTPNTRSAQPKKEKPPKEKGPKKETPKKEAKGKKEDKKEAAPAKAAKESAAPADTATAAIKEAEKAKEKLIKKVVKEGGKKGVEIEGASDMRGLEFFCTTIEAPEGDENMLQMAMTAMNAAVDPDDSEERKGCSGHVGKMVFSAGVKQLAIVAYVPQDKTAKINIQEWIESVCAAVAGNVTTAAAKADSPNGGLTAVATVVADPAKGKFPLKDKDAAMSAAFAFLRSKGAFPEDDGDDSDDMVFGDDDNLDDYM